MRTPPIDIVIPFGAASTTRPGSLVATVAALTQVFLVSRITVVANGPIGRSGETELSLLRQRWPSLTILAEVEPNLSRARNRGACRGTSDFILFCDSDTVASPSLLETLLEQLSSDTFLFGAKRCYVPLSIDTASVVDAIEARKWEYLDAVSTAQPARNTTSVYASIDPPMTMRYSFFGSFGLVTRSLFQEVGGFDDAYDSWGLEDVDLMRRLLRTARCKLIQNHNVWHLDHLVEPFRMAEHWHVHWPRYCHKARTCGLLWVDRLFERDSWNAGDLRVFFAPCKDPVREEVIASLPVSKHIAGAVRKHVLALLTSSETCGAVIFGSTRFLENPNDIDILNIVYPLKVRRHRTLESDGVKVDELTISLFDIPASVSRPGRDPDNWLFVLARFNKAGIICAHAQFDAMFSQIQAAAFDTFAYHILTYHTGNLLKELRGSGWNVSADAGRHLASLLALAHRCFPEMHRFPFFYRLDLSHDIATAVADIQSSGELGLMRVLNKIYLRFMAGREIGSLVPIAIYSASHQGWQFIKACGLDLPPPRWADA